MRREGRDETPQRMRTRFPTAASGSAPGRPPRDAPRTPSQPATTSKATARPSSSTTSAPPVVFGLVVFTRLPSSKVVRSHSARSSAWSASRMTV